MSDFQAAEKIFVNGIAHLGVGADQRNPVQYDLFQGLRCLAVGLQRLQVQFNSIGGELDDMKRRIR